MVTPDVEIVGVAGTGLTVTTVGAEVTEQLPLETVTEYETLVDTVIDCVVAPFDQVFPVADEDVKTTEPPWQNVVDPDVEIVGVVNAFGEFWFS